jgi:16S rRNA (guanine966-N2)-methyltransferase
MRVIAGSAGGINLDVPKKGVRPTMDRVKAAIFSSLGEMVIGARVLDLFAGSGGLGIEALSRGASSAVFVDSDRRSIEVIERNLTRAGVKGPAYCRDVFDFLRTNRPENLFEIIFADPPYDRTPTGTRFSDLLLENESLPNLLAPNGIFVLEKRPEEELLIAPSWQLVRAKKYGATEVLFLSVVRDRQPEA